MHRIDQANVDSEDPERAAIFRARHYNSVVRKGVAEGGDVGLTDNTTEH